MSPLNLSLLNVTKEKVGVTRVRGKTKVVKASHPKKSNMIIKERILVVQFVASYAKVHMDEGLP